MLGIRTTMSILTIRTNLFNENFLNDSEQDANSVLTELDKGLRSTKVGVQCEAIVRFPRLFEKYPFPILINSSFLKLAEFFLNGSNLLRFWVLRVCQQSENQLDKILSIDAFVKRIYMVTHSNDPVARALTLRTLGAVSRVIPEKQQVHHALRRALDSHDTVEVEAAIFASGQFAAQSRTFAISMCAKISDMIESLQIPVPMKLQLIPVLRHMHHDANTAALVKKLCLKLLPKYPAESFVVAVLASLTELSARTLTGVPDQVNLLLEFMNDLRKPVRAQALKSLNKLAEKQCVHAWPKSAINDLITKASACSEPAEQYLFLGIILKLSDYPLTCHILLADKESEGSLSVLDLCNKCLCLNDYTTASQVITVLASLVCYASVSRKTKHITTIMEMIDLHMQSLLMCTVQDQKHSRDLRKILASGIRVSSVKTNFGLELVTTLVNLLNDPVEYPTLNEIRMCEALGSLCSFFQMRKFAPPETIESDEMETDQTRKERTNPVVKNLLLIMRKLTATVERSSSEEPVPCVEILSSVALQALVGCFMPTTVMRTFEKIIAKANPWSQYRIARSASRYGQHFLAAHTYLKVSRCTVVDKLHFFLTGLAQLAQAECILNYCVTYQILHDNYEESESHIMRNKTMEQSIPIMQRLEISTNLYWQALASLRASSSPSHPLTFQLEFLKLRAQFLQTLHSAVTIKNAQIIVPPPAIAGSLAQNSRDYLQKFGHVTNQLRKLVKELKGCEESFGRLYKSAFDADPLTLEFLEIVQYQCVLFAHIVETICYATPSDPPDFQTEGKCPESRYLINCCHRMKELSKSIPQESANNKTISNFHFDILLSEIEIITKTPLCLPRYFFQVLQSTQIKLSVSPQPRGDGKPVNVQAGSNLVIKVEGVIQHYGKKPSQFRSVDFIQLCLVSKLLTPRPPGELVKPHSDTVTLTQTVKPQRDFLSGNFLVPISSGGQWQVTLETYVIDENGITWCTGPKNSMLVRVLDDPTKQQQQAPSTSAQTRRF